MTNKRQKMVCIALCAMVVILGLVMLMTLQEQDTTVAQIVEVELRSSESTGQWSVYSGSTYYLRLQVYAKAEQNAYVVENKYYYAVNSASFRFQFGQYKNGVGGAIDGSVSFYLKSTSGTVYQKQTFSNYVTYAENLGGTTSSDINFTSLSNGTYALCADYSYTRMSNTYKGTHTIATIVIDTVSPTGTLSGVNSNGYSNTSVKCTWSDTTVTARLNGNSYTSGTSITAEGTYNLVLTDRAQNSTTYTFTIDKTAPKGTLSGVSNGGITNGNVTFTWTESAATAKLNGTNYTQGSTISAEKQHTIVLTDLAGNSTTYTFTIDKTAPTGTLSGVSNGGYTNGNVTFTWTDTAATAKLNGAAYSKGSTISDEREHTIVLTDLAGNSTTYTFTIDKTAPIIGLRKADNSTFADGAWVNQGVYFDVTDTYLLSNILYKLNGATWEVIDSAYISGTIYYDTRLPSILYGTYEQAFSTVLEKEMGRMTGRSNWSTFDGDTRIIHSTQVDLAMQGAPYWEFETYEGQVYVFFDVDACKSYIEGKASGYVAYKNQNMFMQDGQFKIVCTDLAGNSTTKTFNIKTTLPTLLYELPAYGNAEQIVYSVEDYVALKTYVRRVDYGNSSEWILLAVNTDIKFGTDEDGTYQFKTVDIAGNVIINTVVLDNTVPILTAERNGAVVDEIYVKDSDTLKFKVQDVNDSKDVLLDGVRRLLSDIPSISGLSEGRHEVIAIDKAGNLSAACYFIVDRTLPTVSVATLDDDVIEVDELTGKYYVNVGVKFVVDDTNLSLLCVYKDGSQIVSENVTTVAYEALSNNFGVYSLFAEDKAGNRSETIELTLQIIEDFGNLDTAYKAYKLNYWYEVTLPDYIFGTSATADKISGTYTFEKQESAMAWALAMEEQYRVQRVTDGWIYVSATNESISQKYASRSDLDKVLTKYAQRYVSSRKTSSILGNDNYYVVKDDDGNTDEYALVRQSMTLPGYLSPLYDGLRVFQIKPSYVFKACATALTATSTTLTYIADDFDVQTNVSFTMDRGVSVKDKLKSVDSYKQGYYLVEERDLCGNVQRYVVYLDLEAPTLSVEMEKGDGSRQAVVIDNDYAEDNANIFYLISFNINAILDNVDAFTSIKIEGRGISQTTYTQGETLPVLDYELGGGGQYVITVYDRSANSLTFKVNIAGVAPYMEYNSLKETNRRLTLYFNAGDRLNQIVRLEIYKVNGAGESVRIERDDDSTLIDFTTLEYNFTVGGKYYAVIEDRYGRVVTTTPIFYERGLPLGILEGVTSGGVTNKDVTFTYSVGNAVYVYEYVGSAWEIYTGHVVEYDNLNKVYTLTFLSYENTEKQYMVYLYNESDDNLFIEYTFAIDTIIAPITISEHTGLAVEKNGYTNKPFRLSWTENGVMLKYTIGSSSLTYNYAKGDVLSGNGMYNFTLTDRVGNVETFTVYLDNFVDYTLVGGKIINVSGRYLTGGQVSVVVNEAYTYWNVAEDDTIQPDRPIVNEGTYTITIRDRYDNEIVIVIEIDLTAPTFTLEGVTTGGVTKSSVVVSFEDGAKCYLTNKNAVVREIASGEVFTAHGAYTLYVEDLVGNRADISYSIDTKVDFSSNVINRQHTTGKVTFSLLEDGVIEVKKDGEVVSGQEFTEVGKYVVRAEDKASNVIEYSFTILPANAQSASVELATSHRVTDVTLNGAAVAPTYDESGTTLLCNETGRWQVTISDVEQGQSYSIYLNVDNVVPEVELIWQANKVSFSKLNKEGVIATLTKDGVEMSWSQNSVIEEPGHYVLTLSDEFGNVKTIEWVIEYRLNTLSIVLITIAAMGVIVGVIVIIRSRKLKVS